MSGLSKKSTQLMNGIFQGDFMEESSYKVPGGKLVKIKLLRKPLQKIEVVQILGDFFLHPEEAIVDIERALVNVDLEEASIVKTIESVLTKRNAIIIGAKPADIAKAILQASELA